MKNILFITINDHVPWGGSEVLWSNTAFTLAEDYNVSALIKRWDEEHKAITTLKNKGVSIYYKNNPLSFVEKIQRKVFKKKGNKRHVLEREGINNQDLVVISLGNHLDWHVFAFAEYLKRHNIPYVIVFQLITELRGLTDESIDRFRSTYVNAEKLFFVSQDNLELLELQLAERFSNTCVINNPFQYDVEYLPIASNITGYHLASVAALNSFHKGQDVLLKVLSEPKWKERSLTINLYGSGHNKGQIERLISQFGLEDKVILKGHVSNKADIWKHNHGLIMPSRMEGQSLALLEAMSYGRTPISTKLGDAERLITHKENGFIIDAMTPEFVDKTLEEAWQSRAQWAEMGVASRKRLYEVIPQDPIEAFASELKTLL